MVVRTFLANGARGMVVLATASVVGVLAESLGVRKAMLSPALNAPSLAHFFGLTAAIAAALL